MKFGARPAVDRPNRRTTGFSSRPPALCRFARVTAKSAARRAADAVNKATFCLSQNLCSLATGAAGCGGCRKDDRRRGERREARRGRRRGGDCTRGCPLCTESGTRNAAHDEASSEAAELFRQAARSHRCSPSPAQHPGRRNWASKCLTLELRQAIPNQPLDVALS